MLYRIIGNYIPETILVKNILNMETKIVGIAINDYQDSQIKNLNNCLNDLSAVIDVLTSKYDFTDIELLSGEEQTTYSFIYNRLYDIFVNSLEDDSILLIFAGHGEYNSTLETSYWLTQDSIKNDSSTWFNVSNLIEFMRASKAKHISLVSDSCFSGAIFESNMRGGGITAIENRKSRIALTSGSIERVSDGKNDSLSPFTRTLIETLNNNIKSEYLFTTLSEDTIVNFSQTRQQTPLFGSLFNAGHKGGSFVFRLKEIENKVLQNINLALDINSPIVIDYKCIIPLFHKNALFDYNFVNTFIQQLGYSIINEARIFFLEDEDYYIERSNETAFLLEINYTIDILNQKFLSLTVSRFDYFGGAHPNNYIYSINFAFKPDRKISLDDLIDYSEYENFEKFLIDKIEKHTDNESKEILRSYVQYLSPYDLHFSFNEETLTIYFLNEMPRVIMAAGFLEIPIDTLKFKLK